MSETDIQFEPAVMHLLPLAPNRGRPVVARRRRVCQEFLLSEYLRGKSVRAAIAALRDMHSADIAVYQRIVGDSRLLETETLLDYWKSIPRQTRDDAASLRKVRLKLAASRQRGPSESRKEGCA